MKNDAPDWRGKRYDEKTHQWTDAEPAPADAPAAPVLAADVPAGPVRRGRPGASADTAESNPSAPE